MPVGNSWVGLCVPVVAHIMQRVFGQPTLTPEQVSRIFGLSRNGTYDAIKRGEIASVRLGKKILVPTAVIRKMLSIEAA